MAETAQTYLSNKTLIPIGFAVSIVLMATSAIVGYTTHGNQIDMLIKENAEIKAEMANLVQKEMLDYRFGRIESDIAEIKNMLKKKE